jgi:hypothetical protein
VLCAKSSGQHFERPRRWPNVTSRRMALAWLAPCGSMAGASGGFATRCSHKPEAPVLMLRFRFSCPLAPIPLPLLMPIVRRNCDGKDMGGEGTNSSNTNQKRRNIELALQACVRRENHTSLSRRYWLAPSRTPEACEVDSPKALTRAAVLRSDPSSRRDARGRDRRLIRRPTTWRRPTTATTIESWSQCRPNE